MSERYELCCVCDDRTGRAGRADDSIYIGVDNVDFGPLCERCRDEVMEWCLAEFAPDIAALRAENARLKGEVEQEREAKERTDYAAANLQLAIDEMRAYQDQRAGAVCGYLDGLPNGIWWSTVNDICPVHGVKSRNGTLANCTSVVESLIEAAKLIRAALTPPGAKP